MAECLNNKESQSESGSQMECAVCLQNCVHPAELPCGHIFCFLCVKGIANQSKRCAMCRQEIPSDFIEHPKLLDIPDTKETVEQFDGGYQWFYEGRNGWWQYDERTSKELESAYKAGERTCELLIAGFLYIADFHSMVQRRRNDPARRRRIKRDLATIPKKGIAGLKFGEEHSETSESPILLDTNCPTPPVTPAEYPHSLSFPYSPESPQSHSTEFPLTDLPLPDFPHSPDSPNSPSTPHSVLTLPEIPPSPDSPPSESPDPINSPPFIFPFLIYRDTEPPNDSMPGEQLHAFEVIVNRLNDLSEESGDVEAMEQLEWLMHSINLSRQRIERERGQDSSDRQDN